MVWEKLAASKSDARRLIEQGGAKLNDQVLTLQSPLQEGILKVGKRKFLKVKIVG